MHVRTQRVLDNYLGRLGIGVLRPAARLLGLLLRRDHELTIGDELVWLKLLGGGSLLLAMPMLVGFRRAHPTVKMVLITTAPVKPFAELIGVFDEYRVVDVASPWSMLWSGVSVLRRSLRADCIIDLEVHSRLTTVFATLTLARNRIGFWLDNIFWRRGLASHLVFFNRASGSYYFYDRIGDLFGVSTATRESCRAMLLQSCRISPLVQAAPDRVCVGFACSELGQERMLTSEQWLQAFRDNIKSNHRIFALLGGAADRARAEELIGALITEFPQYVFRNYCGELSLGDSVAMLFTSSEFWGIDSGLLHLARIAGIRCVSYWGPTDPATRLRDTWEIDEVVNYRKIACSPCVHTSEEPPCNGDNRCIQGLWPSAGEDVSGWTPIEYPRRRVGARA